MFQVLVETNKGTRVSEIYCSGDSCSIGKHPDNLVTLHGWNVDKVHAKLVRTTEGLFVYDLGSRMGTRVNGERVREYGPLTEEDVVEIHDYRIRVKSNRPRQQMGEAQAVEPMSTVPPPPAPATIPIYTAASQQAQRAPAPVSAPSPVAAVPEPLAFSPEEVEREQKMREARAVVRERLLQQMDLRRINVTMMSDTELRRVTGNIVREIVGNMQQVSPLVDREELIAQVIAESVGLGPLEALVNRDDISEIMVNSAQEIFYEQNGRIYKSSVTFTDDKAVQAAIERIVVPLGRRIDESSPMVDARLKDGSRVNAVIPPLALKGSCLTIRKFMKEKLTAQHLIKFGSINEPMVRFLETAVAHKRNVIISGGTGSGKTTLLNVLSGFIPPDERIITVEDAAELQLHQPNLVSLEARPANQEGKGAVVIRDLVRNCLRMRPDRIVVGECRGAEALDMLQAMNTGHDGSLTTAHANSPRDCLGRLEVMVMMTGMDLSVSAIREQIASAINLIVQQTRFSCGTRKVTSVCEITGLENGRVQLAEIFRFRQQGFDDQGRVKGTFEATGLIPQFYEELRRRGIDVDTRIFKSGAEE
jgi:pilus assembly protein CpaF